VKTSLLVSMVPSAFSVDCLFQRGQPVTRAAGRGAANWPSARHSARAGWPSSGKCSSRACCCR